MTLFLFLTLTHLDPWICKGSFRVSSLRLICAVPLTVERLVLTYDGILLGQVFS